MHTQAFAIQRDHLTLRGQALLPDAYQASIPGPAVILSHCFGGSGKTMVKYAAPFLDLGYAAFVFDFCGGGIASQSDGCQLDLCFASECADLNTMIGYVRSLPFVDGQQLTLVGESMGGMISAMVAPHQEIEQLVMISPAFCAPDDARKGAFGGASYALDQVPEVIHCSNGMQVSRAFHEEACATDVWQAISGYQGRALLLHGMDDPVVPFAYALESARHYHQLELHIMPLMGHCSMNNEQLDNVLRAMRLFLSGKHEVLHIDVEVTGAEPLRNDLTRPEPNEDLGGDFIQAVNFTGTADSLAFHGTIAPGGVDRQTIRGGKMIRLCAEYTLTGTDQAGQPCSIHIVNSGIDGSYRPVIRTDSRLLHWLNDADLTALLEMRAQGPVISIWG